MVFIKHNSLKSDRFFNTIFIPCLSRSRFFWIQVFQGPDPGFRSSQFFLRYLIQPEAGVRVSFWRRFSIILAQVFSCEFCEILRTPFFIDHLLQLLLEIIHVNIKSFLLTQRCPVKKPCKIYRETPVQDF